ncbi:MAG: Mo-dependent nitrogenase C-terminal domain-containing protein [Cyanobacteria bacterium P01_H01_bin.15]
MTSSAKVSYSNEEVVVWLRGLLTIAWADGNYDDEEQALIVDLTQKLAFDDGSLSALEPIEAADLAKVLGRDRSLAENFLRTAVMVSVADGIYSKPEADLLEAFDKALGLGVKALKSLEETLYHPEKNKYQDQEHKLEPLKPIKEWLDGMDVQDPRVAKFMCRLIPSQCPFERDVVLFGKKVVHIPAMCKLNPLYEQLVGLRFRALSYLADECDEDVSEFI